MSHIHKKAFSKRKMSVYVYVINRDGVISAYYVDKGKLVVLAGFLRLNSSSALIFMDTVHYKIDGFNGSLVACEEIAVDGKQFFLMQNEQHGNNAAYVVLPDDGKVAVPQSKGFDDSTLDMIQKFLHPPIPPPVQDKPPLENWQKYYENGEYLRSTEITMEQNYDMVDCRINNFPKPRLIDGRASALERLKIKQAEIAIRSGKPIPRGIEKLNEERSRK